MQFSPCIRGHLTERQEQKLQQSPGYAGFGAQDVHPTRDEDQNCRVLHALGDSSDDESWSDDGEHQLKHRVEVLRYPVSLIGVRCGSDAVKEEEFRPAIKWVVEILAEHEAISESPPENGHQPGDSQALGQDR